MSEQNTEPVIVHLYVETGFSGASHEDDIEIDRAEWDAMTPDARRALVDDEAQVLMENSIAYGWHIEDEDDRAATEDGTR